MSILNESEQKELEARRERWKELVEGENLNAPALEGNMKGLMYKLLENTEKSLSLDEATQTGDIAQYTPVLMSLIRRVVPSLIGTQLVGVQAMSAPTGRIFVQHVYYGPNKNGGEETWMNGTVGTETAAGAAPKPNHTGPYTTEDGEKLGWPSADGKIYDEKQWPEMSFAIDYVDVSVKTRALKGKLTTEIVQDLKAVHGLDAESELANILQAEITAEMDREIIDRIRVEAKTGAQNCATKGVFDFAVDADGRWSMEKVQGLLIQLEREATWIGHETRRGRGNFIITSPEMAAYLSMANLISTEYANTGFIPVVNPIGASYYGMLTGRFRVYVDNYQTAVTENGVQKHTIIVGYKGANAYDNGIFLCPYVPLQFFRANGQEDFGLRLGLKSRYGIVSNPYYCQSATNTTAAAGTNSYYRKFDVIVD